MAAVRGLVLAFGVFAVCFALHIVGGASDQQWLFNIAVALIFLSASGFPVLALLLAGRPVGTDRNLALNGGFAIGTVLTASALWAANGRTFAWWEIPAGAAAVIGVSAVLVAVLRLWPAGGAPRRRRA